MNTDGDLKVNFADDIILDGMDVVSETNNFISAMRNAQRRISARQTDNQLITEIAAGIESYLQDSIDIYMLSDLEATINSCLTYYGLFKRSEFKVLFDTTNQDKLGVIVSFSPETNELLDGTTFSVYVDKQNLRSYV